MKNVNFLCYDSLFSSRLRKLIKDKNISMQTLSSEIGASRQATSQYCDGSTVPNADKLLKIAEYFNVSIDYLVGRTDTPTTDKDLRFICDYTGLSDETVALLHSKIVGQVPRREKMFKFINKFMTDFADLYTAD